MRYAYTEFAARSTSNAAVYAVMIAGVAVFTTTPTADVVTVDHPSVQVGYHNAGTATVIAESTEAQLQRDYPATRGPITFTHRA